MSLRYALKRLTPNWMIETLAKYGFVRRVTGIGYFGLFKIDRKIAAYLPKRGGYYVELGANDGITQSNTYHFEKYRKFTGILVEPIPAKYQECKKNRSGDNFFANNACVGFDYPGSTVELLYSNLMTTTLSGASDIVDRHSHAKSGEHLIKSNIYKFKISARTLNSILMGAKAPTHIDLLSLDVEGSELEVLKGIDFEKHVFSVMCIESRDIGRIAEFLKDKNYRLEKKISIHDYLFVYTGKESA